MKAATPIGVAVFLALSLAAIARANGYELYIITLVGLTAVVGIGLNILVGLAGQISLGHVGFYAIGAYTAAILTVQWDWSFWPALLCAGLAAGVAGMLLAMPALRVTGPYLAMVTIAFGFVVEQGAAEWKELTGGWNGIMNIPLPSIMGHGFDERGVALLATGLTAVSLILFARLGASPWGMAMRATRDSEIAAQSCGLNVVAVRTVAFTLSAVLAGIAGAVFGSITNFISPESFPFFQSILFLLAVMIGGAGTVLGPLVGAIVVVLLPELLSFLAEYRLLFVGALLLVVLWLAPEGVVGAIAKLLTRENPRPASPGDLDVPQFLAERRTGFDLRLAGLALSFGGIRAVADVSLAARAGEVTSIIGPNGAGKTTLLNMLGGFYRPDAGRILLGDRDLAGLPSYAAARAGVGRTYQTTHLFPRMSVLDNLLIALRQGRLGSIAAALFGARRDAAARATAESLLAFVGYAGPVEQLAGALPHVDKRLVEIARALAAQPQVLLLDEPAAGLSPADTQRLGQLLRRLAEAGLVVVLVEHDMGLVMGVSDHVIVLDGGNRIADGSPAEVRADPAVRKAYFGEGEIRGARRPAGWAGPGAEVLAIDALTAGYGAAPVIEDVAMRVASGELVAVLGANGAGKSTLMRAICGLHRSVRGTIRLDGREVTALPAHRIAGAGMNMVPEGRQVFPELSVIDNIALGAYTRRDFDAATEVTAMLERFPALGARRHSRAGFLSGGEQQMLAIARGLVARPRVLMLDEPSLGLAPALVDELYRVLAELREDGMTILLVDQMATLALSVADRGYVIESGRIVYQGTAAALRSEPKLEQAYFGDTARSDAS